MGYFEEAFKNEINKVAQRGGGLRLLGTDVCVCPNCKKEIPHPRGTPCNLIKCPACSTPMTGKGMPQSGKGQAK